MRSPHDPRYSYGNWAHRLDHDDMMADLYGEDFDEPALDDVEDHRGEPWLDDDEELTDE